MQEDKIIARRTLARTIAGAPAEWEWTNGLHLHVTAELHHYAGNRAPHFSVTGEVWDSAGWRRNGQDGRMRAAGVLDELIRSQFPELAPLLDLHLADDAGEPMHAEANGWYWYSDADGKGTHLDAYPSWREETGERGAFVRMTPHERAAHHLRIRPEELPEDLDREAFGAFVEELRARWKAEAEAAMALFGVPA